MSPREMIMRFSLFTMNIEKCPLALIHTQIQSIVKYYKLENKMNNEKFCGINLFSLT